MPVRTTARFAIPSPILRYSSLVTIICIVHQQDLSYGGEWHRLLQRMKYKWRHKPILRSMLKDSQNKLGSAGIVVRHVLSQEQNEEAKCVICQIWLRLGTLKRL